MKCNKKHRYNDSFTSLPNDQGGSGRHKSPHAAYAQGYLDGVHKSYN